MMGRVLLVFSGWRLGTPGDHNTQARPTPCRTVSHPVSVSKVPLDVSVEKNPVYNALSPQRRIHSMWKQQ